tara:strand:+ start:576 stop:941 length:366 start_codon:yes stop_codon:yes gene_type:complete
MTSKKKISTSGPLINEKHVKGVISEIKATEILIKNGFLVYRNVTAHGMVDIVAIDGLGKIYLIDVKTISFRKKYFSPADKIIRRIPSNDQKKLGVILMIIDGENFTFSPVDCALSKKIKSQ